MNKIAEKIKNHIEDLKSVQSVLQSYKGFEKTIKEIEVAVSELSVVQQSIVNEEENNLSDLRAKTSIIFEMSTRQCVNCKYLDDCGICSNKKSFCFGINVSSNPLFGCTDFRRHQNVSSLDELIDGHGSIEPKFYTFEQDFNKE